MVYRKIILMTFCTVHSIAVFFLFPFQSAYALQIIPPHTQYHCYRSSLVLLVSSSALRSSDNQCGEMHLKNGVLLPLQMWISRQISKANEKPEAENVTQKSE